MGSLSRNSPNLGSCFPCSQGGGPRCREVAELKDGDTSKAEGSFSVDCLMERVFMDAGSMVGTSFSWVCCSLLHIGWCLCSKPSCLPGGEGCFLHTEPQGLNGRCLSRNPQHRRVETALFRGRATSGSALCCGSPAAEGHPVSAHSTSVLTCFL